MASRKFNGARARALGGRGLHAAGPVGGVGGVAPDVNASLPSCPAHRGAAPGRSACGSIRPDAGHVLPASLPCPARPDKPALGESGLCGQVRHGYYSAYSGKSFQPIMSRRYCTSYKVEPAAPRSRGRACSCARKPRRTRPSAARHASLARLVAGGLREVFSCLRALCTDVKWWQMVCSR